MPGLNFGDSPELADEVAGHPIVSCGRPLAANTSASSSDAGAPLLKYHPPKALDAVEVSLVKSLLAAIGVDPFALALQKQSSSVRSGIMVPR
jgi:hypothetical protein